MRHQQPQGGPVAAIPTALGALPVVRTGWQDAATGLALPLNFRTTPPVSVLGPSGLGSSYGAGGGQLQTLSRAPGLEWSVVVLLRAASPAGASRSFVDCDQSSSRVFQGRVNTSNQWEFIRFDTGSSPYFVSAGTPSGLDQVVVLVNSGATFSVIVDGVLVGSSVIWGTPKAWSDPRLLIGAGLASITNFGGSGTQEFNGTVYSVTVLGHALPLEAAPKTPQQYWQMAFPLEDASLRGSSVAVSALGATGRARQRRAGKVSAATGFALIGQGAARVRKAGTSAVAAAFSLPGTGARRNRSVGQVAAAAGFTAQQSNARRQRAVGSVGVARFQAAALTTTGARRKRSSGQVGSAMFLATDAEVVGTKRHRAAGIQLVARLQTATVGTRDTQRRRGNGVIGTSTAAPEFIPALLRFTPASRAVVLASADRREAYRSPSRAAAFTSPSRAH